MGPNKFINDVQITHGKPLILPDLNITLFSESKDMANQLSLVEEDFTTMEQTSINLIILLTSLMFMIVITIVWTQKKRLVMVCRRKSKEEDDLTSDTWKHPSDEQARERDVDIQYVDELLDIQAFADDQVDIHMERL
ncbi:hypothetical protein HUJ04_012196 [Dendroctonus ponderosae]|nr:hypothetical protein HUJ04_012196 [Dendroctonus ponderosae]